MAKYLLEVEIPDDQKDWLGIINDAEGAAEAVQNMVREHYDNCGCLNIHMDGRDWTVTPHVPYDFVSGWHDA